MGWFVTFSGDQIVRCLEVLYNLEVLCDAVFAEFLGSLSPTGHWICFQLYTFSNKKIGYLLVSPSIFKMIT